MDKVQKIREDVERLKSQLLRGACSSQIAMETKCKEEAYDEVLTLLDSMQEEPKADWLQELHCKLDSLSKEDFEKVWAKYAQKEEPVSEDLEEAIGQSFTYHENRGDDFRSDKQIETAYRYGFETGVKWKKENLWKSAEGDDLPIIDREVIALVQDYPDDKEHLRVVFAHRPNPNGWDGKSIATGNIEHYTPKTYGEGGWNIPNIVYWLDVELPKEIEL